MGATSKIAKVTKEDIWKGKGIIDRINQFPRKIYDF